MNKMRVFTSLQNGVAFQQPPLCSHEWINRDDRYRNEFYIKPMIFNEKYIVLQKMNSFKELLLQILLERRQLHTLIQNLPVQLKNALPETHA